MGGTKQRLRVEGTPGAPVLGSERAVLVLVVAEVELWQPEGSPVPVASSCATLGPWGLLRAQLLHSSTGLLCSCSSEMKKYYKKPPVYESFFVLTMSEMAEGRFLGRGSIFYGSDCWNRDSSLHGLCLRACPACFPPGSSSGSNKTHCLYKSSSLRSSCLPQNS